MKKTAKKLLSIALVLVMVLSLLPTTVMAASGTETDDSSSKPSVADAFGFKTDPPAGFDASDGVHPFSQSGTNDTINMVPVKEVGLLTTNRQYSAVNSSINVYNFSIEEDADGNEVSDLANFSDETKLFDTKSSSFTPIDSTSKGDDTAYLFRLASGVAYDPTGSGRDNHVFYYGADASIIYNYSRFDWNYLLMQDFSYEGGEEGTVASGRLDPNEGNSQKDEAYYWATSESVDEAPDKYLSVVAGNFNGNGKETVVLYDPQFGNFTLKECTVKGENIETSPVFDLGNEITVKNSDDYQFYTLNDMVTKQRNYDPGYLFPKFMPLVQLTAGDLDGDEKDELVVTVTPLCSEYVGNRFDISSQVLIFNKENDGEGNAVWNLKASDTPKVTSSVGLDGAAAVIGDFNNDNKNELVLVGNGSTIMMRYSSGQLTSLYKSYNSGDLAPEDDDVYPVYSIPSVGAVRLKGTGTSPYLFASGKFFQYKDGTFQNAYEVTSSMTFYDYADPIRSQPIIGNFDGNAAGREQLFVAVRGTKGNGDIIYGIDCLSVEDGDLSLKYTESDADALGRMVLTAPDADNNDGMVMRYTGKEYVFSNPEVMAVLQASPYFEDLLDDYENVGVTGFGTSSGTGNAFSNTVTNTVGAYVSFSQDISVFGVKLGSVEFQTAYNYEWSKTNATEHTYTTSISYEAGSGSNQVVMIATPVTLYHYDVLDASGVPIATSGVSVPDAPCYSVIPVEDYNASAELLGNPVIDSSCVVNVVPGQPQTYPSSKWQIDSYGGVCVPFDTPVLASQGNAVISQEISVEDSQSLTQSYSHNVEVSGGAGPLGFVIGASYSYSKGQETTEIVTSGVCRSGSVANIPAGNPDYSFKWQFATWDILVGGCKVPVMGYIVSSVSQPPSIPQNLTATPGTDSVTLEWEPGYNSAVKYDIFRYYPEEKEDYQYDLIGTVDGTETEFVCEGLNPSTRYYFAVRAVGDKGLRSRYTEPVAVTTISPGQALPEIIIQPQDQYIDLSSTRETTFSTLANPTSRGVVNYAWERRDDSSSAWETISAGTYVAGYASRSLTLYDLTGSMDGTQYRCRVAERSAAPYPAVVYTRAVTLTVGRAPTTTTLTSPSDAGYGVLGSEVKLQASVSASDKSACGGDVSFQITNTATGDVTTLMADSSTAASWTPFTAGVYTIRAAYSGDGTTESSVSETVTYYVQKDDATPCYEITLSGDLVYGETITPSLNSVNNGQSTPVSDVTFMRYLHDGTEFKQDSPSTGWVSGTLIPGEYRVDAVVNDTVVAQKVFTVGKRPITITAPNISSIVEGTKFDLSSHVGEIRYPENFEEKYKNLFALSGVTAEKPLSGQYDISVVYQNPDDPELIGFLQRYQPTFEKSVFTVIPSNVADNLRTVAFSTGVNGSVKAYVSTTSTKEITVSPYGVSKGSTVFFSPEADEGFSVSRWTINGTEVTEEAIKAGKFSYCGSVRFSGTGLIVEGLQSDINVKVEFTSQKYSVSFSGIGSGSVTAIQGSTELGSPVEVIGGSSITFTAVPAEGSVVTSWTITPANGTPETKLNPDGSSYTGATLTLENINDNYTVDVAFEEAGDPLKVTCDVVDANGNLTDGGLVTFTAEGMGEDGTALKGSTVKLTANPKPGTAILRWEVYEGNTWVTKSASTDEFTIYNLQADTSVRVVIRPNSTKYTVAYSIVGKNSEDTFAGTLTAKTGEMSVSSGSSRIAYSSLVFTYVESEDYELVRWNVTGTKGTEASDGTTHTYTISSLNAGTIVMAEVQKKPKVTVDSSIENGSVFVTYQWNGETVTPTANGYVYTGTVATVTATPADGYVVDTIKANGTTILTGDKTVGVKTADAYSINANTTLTATFAAIPTYTITFETNGGTEVAPITQDYGTIVTAPEKPAKAGYGFGGWYEDETLSSTPFVFTEDTTITDRNITLYAKWNPLDGTTYTVKHNFENLDGSTYTTETEEMSGTTDTDTAAQAKTVTGFTAGSVTQQIIKGDESTVIEINYTRNTYTLTFKPENGEDDIVTTVKYGAAITAPADLEKTGYTFGGWYTDGGTKFDFTTPITGDITLTAKFEDATSTVKLGDVNLDGNVDYLDLQRLYQHFSTSNALTGEALAVANVNGDTTVDYFDLQRLYQHLSTDNKLF